MKPSSASTKHCKSSAIHCLTARAQRSLLLPWPMLQLSCNRSNNKAAPTSAVLYPECLRALDQEQSACQSAASAMLRHELPLLCSHFSPSLLVPPSLFCSFRGSGTLMRLGEKAPTQLDCISSGCLTLDVALGGGWARGRIVEVYGPESSGKTTLALHAVAEVQKAGGQAVFVDAEHAFNIHFARKLGVNVDVSGSKTHTQEELRFCTHIGWRHLSTATTLASLPCSYSPPTHTGGGVCPVRPGECSRHIQGGVLCL